MLREAKEKYCFIQFQAICNYIKGTWKVIRNLFRAPYKVTCIRQMNKDYQLVGDKDVIVEKFNEYLF